MVDISRSRTIIVMLPNNSDAFFIAVYAIKVMVCKFQRTIIVMVFVIAVYK